MTGKLQSMVRYARAHPKDSPHEYFRRDPVCGSMIFASGISASQSELVSFVEIMNLPDAPTQHDWAD